jgi:hypothetical protein
MKKRLDVLLEGFDEEGFVYNKEEDMQKLLKESKNPFVMQK